MWCTQTAVLMLSQNGTVYSCGLDKDKTHILGLGNCFSQTMPTSIPALKEIKVKQISIWETHACAVDLSGKLYTWGIGIKEIESFRQTEVEIPHLVRIDQAVEVKEAKVAIGYTAFKTSGGYLYIIGDVNCDKKCPSVNVSETKVKQVQGISNYFIRTFCCTSKCIVILTQTGEVIYVDEYIKITKIFGDSCKSTRWKDDRLQNLTVVGEKIVAMSRNKLYIWTQKKTKPPVHPNIFGRKMSDQQNLTLGENSKCTLSSERNLIEKQLYGTVDHRTNVRNLINFRAPKITWVSFWGQQAAWQEKN
jgi:hypothetical protein